MREESLSAIQGIFNADKTEKPNTFTESIDFKQKLKIYQEQVEEDLATRFTSFLKLEKIQDKKEMQQEKWDLTTQAALYSLLAGGKRLRPVLILSVGEMLSLPLNLLTPWASAIEMIHTYSLIHDDLPCMDDDVLRRGKPTCHVQFNEATALLAGDALLNRAYEIVFENLPNGHWGAIQAGKYFSKMAGLRGMIGGQTKDIISHQQITSLEQLETIHRQKTGGLLSAAIMIPFYLAHSTSPTGDKEDSKQEALLMEYADQIGLAFQIKDDLLDVLSDAKTLGKTVGKDQQINKATYVTLLGLKNAQTVFQERMSRADQILKELQVFDLDTDFLAGLNQYLRQRLR